MKTSLKLLFCSFVALSLASPVSAFIPVSDHDGLPNPFLTASNPTIAWNAYITDHFYKPYAPQGAHQLAELTTSVHDAINTITKRYEFFLHDMSVNVSTSDIPDHRNRRINAANVDAAIGGVYVTLLPILYADLQYYNSLVNGNTQNPNPYIYNAADLATLTADVQAFYNARIQKIIDANAALNPRSRSYIDPNTLKQQINDGFAIGKASALTIHEARAGDGHSRYQFYNPQPPSNTYLAYFGQWRTSNGREMAYAQYGDIKPFAIDAITNYWANPPPKINDPQYVADIKEIMHKGTNGQAPDPYRLPCAYDKATGQPIPLPDADGNIQYDPNTGEVICVRQTLYVRDTTPEEMDVAKWMTGLGADQMVNYWLPALLTRDFPNVANDIWATARLYALLQVATLDSNVVNQFNKRIYNFWRPKDALMAFLQIPGQVQADGTIAESITDFSPGPYCGRGLPDSCWNPNIATSPLPVTGNMNTFSGEAPNTPEWPAGLPTQVAAGTQILALALKMKSDQPFPGGPLLIQYHPALPTLNFTSLDDFTQKSVDGSVWAGQHARGSGVEGVRQGKYVATEVYANILQKPGCGRVRRFFDNLFHDFDW